MRPRHGTLSVCTVDQLGLLLSEMLSALLVRTVTMSIFYSASACIPMKKSTFDIAHFRAYILKVEKKPMEIINSELNIYDWGKSLQCNCTSTSARNSVGG